MSLLSRLAVQLGISSRAMPLAKGPRGDGTDDRGAVVFAVLPYANGLDVLEALERMDQAARIASHGIDAGDGEGDRPLH